MKSPLCLLEMQARLVERTFTPRRMMLLGVVLVDLALCFAVYIFFAGEPPAIYAMSVFGMLIPGIVLVCEAARALEKEKDNE